jgi:hypothetical protein
MTIDELAARVAELERRQSQSGSWELGAPWMKSVMEGVAGLTMQVSQLQMHMERRFGMIDERFDTMHGVLAAIAEQHEQTHRTLAEILRHLGDDGTTGES